MLLLGFAGMVVGQFMAILDIQIVAASLPQIRPGSAPRPTRSAGSRPPI